MLGRVAMAAFVGSAIEWYDFFLFGTAAALVFGKLYFPTFDPLAGTLASFAIFGVGFFVRPLGGVICGHLGDRIGRKKTLVLTLLVMGVATALVGALPTYASIGVAAPILLVVLRMAQGFGVGGEWGGAALLAVEHAPDGRRGYYGSWPQLGVPAGLLLSTLAVTLVSQLPDEQFMAWGWWLPFLASIVLVAIGLFIRLRVMETPAFARLQASGRQTRQPIVEALRRHPRNVLLVAGMRFSDNVLYYVFATFALTYATGELGLSRGVALTAIMIAAALELVTMPMFGALSDRVGRRPVVMTGALLTALLAFPFFWLADTREPVLLVVATIAVIGIAHAAVFTPLAAFFSELFGTRVRYSGISVGFQLGALVAGAPIPFLATWLLGWSGGSPWPIALLAIVAGVVTLVSAHLATETADRGLVD